MLEEQVKKPKWMERNAQLHAKAQQQKQERDNQIIKYGDEENMKQSKELQRIAKEKLKQVDIVGCFEMGHEPFKIRSLHNTKKKTDGKSYNNVKCTVEWYQTSSKNKDHIVQIKDSRLDYATVRQKAPQLLCDFFERHFTVV